jgi:hypothetical protein
MPIESNNPGKDIILLRQHIDYLKQEKISLEGISISPTLYRIAGILVACSTFSEFALTLLGQIDINKLAEVLKKTDTSFVLYPLSSVIPYTIAKTLAAKALFNRASKINQEKATKLEEIDKAITIDEIIIRQLNKKQ